jgi:hypothetical protein
MGRQDDVVLCLCQEEERREAEEAYDCILLGCMSNVARLAARQPGHRCWQCSAATGIQQ